MLVVSGPGDAGREFGRAVGPTVGPAVGPAVGAIREWPSQSLRASPARHTDRNATFGRCICVTFAPTSSSFAPRYTV